VPTHVVAFVDDQIKLDEEPSASDVDDATIVAVGAGGAVTVNVYGAPQLFTVLVSVVLAGLFAHKRARCVPSVDVHDGEITFTVCVTPRDVRHPDTGSDVSHEPSFERSISKLLGAQPLNANVDVAAVTVPVYVVDTDGVTDRLPAAAGVDVPTPLLIKNVAPLDVSQERFVLPPEETIEGEAAMVHISPPAGIVIVA
jgi:hypothetical protein